MLDQKELFDKLAKHFNTTNHTKITELMIKSGMAETTGEYTVTVVKGFKPLIKTVVSTLRDFGLVASPKLRLNGNKIMEFLGDTIDEKA